MIERVTSSLPRVWFERNVLPDLVDDVAARVTVLGPATLTPEDPFCALATAQGIVAGQYAYDAGIMDLAPDLCVIVRTGIGYDTVDLEAATERGIAVCNAPDGPTVSTAEHALALILTVAKSVKKSENELRAGGSNFYARHDAIELDGKFLGLVGCGRIARRVARAAIGLGMQVGAHDPYLDPSSFPEDVLPVEDLASLLQRSDVVSIHVPATDATKGLFDGAAFELMKEGSILVNAARGTIVDQAALIAALDSGRLRGAGLDVTDPEPLPPDHPLLLRDDVVVTPHVASATPNAKRRIFTSAFDQVLDVLAGERPAHLVNPDVWDRIAASTNRV